MLDTPSPFHRILHFLMSARSPLWRWLYIVAAVPLAATFLDFALGVYAYVYWPYAVTAFLCIVQFFRPTVVGWAAVVGVYGFAFVTLVFELAAQLIDYAKYGGEDHSVFEGWEVSSFSQALSRFLPWCWRPSRCTSLNPRPRQDNHTSA